jgi:hypothetical protein
MTRDAQSRGVVPERWGGMGGLGQSITGRITRLNRGLKGVHDGCQLFLSFERIF